MGFCNIVQYWCSFLATAFAWTHTCTQSGMYMRMPASHSPPWFPHCLFITPTQSDSKWILHECCNTHTPIASSALPFSYYFYHTHTHPHTSHFIWCCGFDSPCVGPGKLPKRTCCWSKNRFIAAKTDSQVNSSTSFEGMSWCLLLIKSGSDVKFILSRYSMWTYWTFTNTRATTREPLLSDQASRRRGMSPSLLPLGEPGLATFVCCFLSHIIKITLWSSCAVITVFDLRGKKRSCDWMPLRRHINTNF